VTLAEDQPGRDAIDDARGLRLLLPDGRERLAAQPLQLLVREGGIQQYVGVEIERLTQSIRECIHAEKGSIQRRADVERGAQRLGAIRDLERAEILRALLQHQHRKACGARFGLRIRGEAGIRDQSEVHDRCGMPLDHHHLETIAEPGALRRR
jgi:hypothetical protein